MPTGLLNKKYKSQSCHTNLMMSDGIAIKCAITIYIINLYYTYIEIKKFVRIGFRRYFTKFSTYLFLPSIFVSSFQTNFRTYIYVSANQ